MKVILFILFALYLTGSSEIYAEGLPLKETFEQYTQAIQKRDLEALFQTVTENDIVHFIGTKGQIMNTRQKYYDFHADWFQETNWKITFKLRTLYEEANLGYVMAVFVYHEDLPNNKCQEVNSWVTLIFHKEEGEWRIIADVCTPILNAYF